MIKPMHNKEESAARLKEIMTVPAMSAERHALILRQRIGHRRMAEDARERARYRQSEISSFT